MESKGGNSKFLIVAIIIFIVFMTLILLPQDIFYKGDINSNETSVNESIIDISNFTYGDIEKAYNDYKTENAVCFYDFFNNEIGKQRLVDESELIDIPISTITKDNIASYFPEDFALVSQVRGVFPMREGDGVSVDDIVGVFQDLADDTVYVISDIEVVGFIDTDIAVYKLGDSNYMMVKYISVKDGVVRRGIDSVALLGSLTKVNTIGDDTLVCGYYIDGLL